MRASALEFRLRFFTHTVIYIVGFLAPWNYWLHLDGTGPDAHVWGLLSVWLAQSGAISIGAAFNLVLCLGIICAVAGAGLRTWGSAYLGAGVMQDGRMRSDRVMADGPYRYVRNPLYLGTFLHTLALAMLMPASGAIFTILLIGVEQVRLILGEEPFLAEKLGEAYLAYGAKVPRLLPALRPQVASGGARPHWVASLLAESYMVGVAISFTAFGWWYNAFLLMKCVLVSFGVSLVARAFSRSGETTV